MIRSFRFLALGVLMISAFAVVSLGQAPANVKIAVIDSRVFYAENGGITKFKNEYQKLGLEFKTDREALQKLVQSVQTLDKELTAMRANKNVPVDPETFRKKQIELDQLSKKLKFDRDSYTERYQRREQELMVPINNDILQKISSFAQSKGFEMVFDRARLQNNGSLLWFKKSADITADFIKYYNALPAGTAAK